MSTCVKIAWQSDYDNDLYEDFGKHKKNSKYYKQLVDGVYGLQKGLAQFQDRPFY